MISQTKKIIFSLLAIVIVLAPLVTYWNNFNSGLSDNNQDWGAFGSYLSGVYSSVFSMISIFVLRETLREMRLTNNQARNQFNIQLQNSLSEKKVNDVIMLTNMLNNIIDTNPSISHKNILPKQFAGKCEAICRRNPVSEEHELWENAIEVMRSERGRFESESYVLTELLSRVNSISETDQRDSAKAIIKGLISNDYRFWLECYIRVWNGTARHELKHWHDFSTIPEMLEKFIPETNDIPE